MIVPLECEYFALRGVALLKTTIDKVRERLNPKLEIDGVLGTMFDGRTLHGREVMERLVQAWGDLVFHTVIRRTVKFSDSTVAGEPITSYASTSTGADAYRQLAKEVLARWPASTTREPAGRRRPVPPHRADARSWPPRPSARAGPVPAVPRPGADDGAPRSDARAAGSGTTRR